MIAGLLCLGQAARAQVTYSSLSVADVFLCTGSPNYENGADLTGLNFGGAGTLAIAPASSAKGEFRSVVMFNFSGAVGLFNSTYGSNNWMVTSVALKLTSNYGAEGVEPNNPIFNTINGGQFVIEWMANTNWAEGTGNPANPTTDGVTWNSLPGLLAQAHVPLGTNTYVPPGDNVAVTWPLPLNTNLVNGITKGGKVAFYFYAADNQIGYLFNSYNYGRGNEPLLQVTATAVPPLVALTGGYFTNAAFHLIGVGAPKGTYQIQMSTPLADGPWLTLGTATAGTNGVIQFSDPAATNAERFYRISP